MGLLGARILFILLHWRNVSFKITDLVSPSGGFAYFGALILSILTMWAYTTLKRKSFLSLLDYAAPFLMLSQVFVRMGCLMAGCCYGRPTDMPFGVIFKAVDNLARHPTQAYEAILLAAIFFAGRAIYKRKKDQAGRTFFSVLLIYGTGRFFVEFFRVDSPAVFLNITLAQAACLTLALLSFLALKRKLYTE